MTQKPSPTFAFKQLSAALAVIILPYAAFMFVALFADRGAHSPAIIAAVSVVFVAYLALFLVFGADRYPALTIEKQKGLFFVTAVILLLIPAFLTRPGVLWIMGMPLVGEAHEQLKKSAWLVYIASALAAIVPYIIYHSLESGLVSLSMVIPAIVFVVYLTEVMMVAQEGQARAEQLTLELEDANRQLGAYAVQAEEMATIEERNRIAREIHDNLGHYLTAVNMQLEAAKTVFDVQPETARDAVGKAQSLTKEGLAAVRQSVTSLREGPVGDRPIPDAIADLIRLNKASGIETAYTITAAPRPLPPKAGLTLYRVVQEALTNVRKHAHAQNATVLLDYSDPAHVTVSVTDDGNGTDNSESGFGLLGIRERVALLGGELVVRSMPKAGFQVTVTIPG